MHASCQVRSGLGERQGVWSEEAQGPPGGSPWAPEDGKLMLSWGLDRHHATLPLREGLENSALPKERPLSSPKKSQFSFFHLEV